LLTLKAPEVVPFSVELRHEVVEVSQMAGLLVVEFGVIGRFHGSMLWDRLGDRAHRESKM
jgi:hypothetical protein